MGENDEEIKIVGQVISKWDCGHDIKIIRLIEPMMIQHTDTSVVLECDHAAVCPCKTKILYVVETETAGIKVMNTDQTGFEP